jgi:hypothetical protein
MSPRRRNQRQGGREQDESQKAAGHDQAETLERVESRARQVVSVSAKIAASVVVPSVSQVT